MWLRLCTATPIASSAAFRSVLDATPAAAAAAAAPAAPAARSRSGRRRRLDFASRQERSRLISHRNEQRSDMFAVLSRLLKGRTSAVTRNALTAESDGDFVGIWVGPFDLARGGRFVHAYVFDDATLFVVQATKKSPRTEQATKAAVREGREGVG